MCSLNRYICRVFVVFCYPIVLGRRAERIDIDIREIIYYSENLTKGK